MRVVCFGTFDIFHKGHEYYLRQAKAFGELWVVVSLDETVLKVKGKQAKHSQSERLKTIDSLDFVDHAILGNSGDKYEILQTIKPDVICLGYDQVAFTDKLEGELKKRGLHAVVKRIDSYEPQVYKSSLLR